MFEILPPSLKILVEVLCILSSHTQNTQNFDAHRQTTQRSKCHILISTRSETSIARLLPLHWISEQNHLLGSMFGTKTDGPIKKNADQTGWTVDMSTSSSHPQMLAHIGCYAHTGCCFLCFFGLLTASRLSCVVLSKSAQNWRQHPRRTSVCPRRLIKVLNRWRTTQIFVTVWPTGKAYDKS